MNKTLALLITLLLTTTSAFALPGGVVVRFATVNRAKHLDAQVVVVAPDGQEYISEPALFCPGVDNFVAIDDVIPGPYRLRLILWDHHVEAVSQFIHTCGRFYNGDEVIEFTWGDLEDVPHFSVVETEIIIPGDNND